jgi:hypothetical protein
MHSRDGPTKTRQLKVHFRSRLETRCSCGRTPLPRPLGRVATRIDHVGQKN